MTKEELERGNKLSLNIGLLEGLVNNPSNAEIEIIGIQYAIKKNDFYRYEEMTAQVLTDEFKQDLLDLAKKHYNKYQEELNNL